MRYIIQGVTKTWEISYMESQKHERYYTGSHKNMKLGDFNKNARNNETIMLHKKNIFELSFMKLYIIDLTVYFITSNHTMFKT